MPEPNLPGGVCEVQAPKAANLEFDPMAPQTSLKAALGRPEGPQIGLKALQIGPKALPEGHKLSRTGTSVLRGPVSNQLYVPEGKLHIYCPCGAKRRRKIERGQAGRQAGTDERDVVYLMYKTLQELGPAP